MIWPCCPKVPRSWRVDGLTLTATFEGPSAHDPLGRFYRAHPLFIPSQLQLLEEKVMMLMVFFTPSTTVKAGHLLCRVISELFAIISPCWALTCETCHAVKAWPHAALKKMWLQTLLSHPSPLVPHVSLMLYVPAEVLPVGLFKICVNLAFLSCSEHVPSYQLYCCKWPPGNCALLALGYTCFHFPCSHHCL